MKKIIIVILLFYSNFSFAEDIVTSDALKIWHYSYPNTDEHDLISHNLIEPCCIVGSGKKPTFHKERFNYFTLGMQIYRNESCIDKMEIHIQFIFQSLIKNHMFEEECITDKYVEEAGNVVARTYRRILFMKDIFSSDEITEIINNKPYNLKAKFIKVVFKNNN